MDRRERLAAYAAGDLDADERRALEAELAGDHGLRRELDAIRAADAALASLPEVELPAGFRARLDARLQPEVAAFLAGAAGDDELAARRSRRLPSWIPAATAAAALLVGAVVVGGSLVGGDDGGGAAGTDPAMEALDAPAAGDAGAAAGPVVAALGRSLDADDLGLLADEPVVSALVAERLASDEGARTAEAYGGGFGVTVAPSGGPEVDAGGEGVGEDGDAPEQTSAVAPLSTAGEVAEEDLATVRRCLDELVAGAGAVIPVYAELLDFAGEDAVAFVLLSEDPATGAYSRVETWVTSRADCQVLEFRQRDTPEP